MYNILIASKDINYIKSVINELSCIQKRVRISHICTIQQEIIWALQNNSSNMIKLDINNLSNRLISNSSIKNIKVVVISEKERPTLEYFGKQPISKVIPKNKGGKYLVKQIEKIIENEFEENVNKKIIREVEYLHYDLSSIGTSYLIDTILIARKKKMLNLEKDIYKTIANKYSKSVNNIKWNIYNATNNMYYECESNKLKEYFKFYQDTKPKVKMVISTILNKISY